ncbi:hypothetical protein GMI69_06380 [Eggerthellaceae bacterium zg-887]|uniref:winged helix-turn-helix transcriptional regulator n=1 Tax=Xiamenia xianingshaonis TaxID=2682776 RepID=UPI00140CB646|nr:helix-turn-helix domain-containing protein [Xiamenia xianingshaonis]NHM16284.1 hypothetical protein [Xiamenia xianingshaonis]
MPTSRFTQEGKRWLFDGRRYKDLTYEEYLEMIRAPKEVERYNNIDKLMPFFCGKWGLPVQAALFFHGPLSFNEIKRLVPGASNSVLSATLKNLETGGLIKRTVYDRAPIRAEYSLTTASEGFAHTMYEMLKWADELD